MHKYAKTTEKISTCNCHYVQICQNLFKLMYRKLRKFNIVCSKRVSVRWNFSVKPSLTTSRAFSSTPAEPLKRAESLKNLSSKGTELWAFKYIFYYLSKYLIIGNLVNKCFQIYFLTIEYFRPHCSFCDQRLTCE